MFCFRICRDELFQVFGLCGIPAQGCRIEQIDAQSAGILLRAPRGFTCAAWSKQKVMIAAGAEQSRDVGQFELLYKMATLSPF